MGAPCSTRHGHTCGHNVHCFTYRCCALLVLPLNPTAFQPFLPQFEREAARRGGGGFVAPAQRVTDFLAGQPPQQPLPTSSYRWGGRGFACVTCCACATDYAQFWL